MGPAILDCMTSLGNGLNYQQPNDVIKYNMAAHMKAKNEGGSKIFFTNKKIFIFNKLEINKAICLTFFTAWFQMIIGNMNDNICQFKSSFLRRVHSPRITFLMMFDDAPSLQNATKL